MLGTVTLNNRSLLAVNSSDSGRFQDFLAITTNNTAASPSLVYVTKVRLLSRYLQYLPSVASPGKDLELMMGDGLANALWDLIRKLSHRNHIPVNLRQSRHGSIWNYFLFPAVVSCDLL